MDSEKQAEFVRLYVRMRQGTDAFHAQPAEVHETAKGLEELTKDTAIWYAGLRVQVEARATREQADENLDCADFSSRDGRPLRC